jgi:hypothetical protein
MMGRNGELVAVREMGVGNYVPYFPHPPSVEV